MKKPKLEILCLSREEMLVIISNKKLLLATEEYYVELRKKFRHTLREKEAFVPSSSVTSFGYLLDFGQLFKACGNN